ncbi:MocR-like pyridoxine biosynthesis transcription factor PdxR [Paenibacillus kobensis]|uniref:MocR-like pyridoxine biosynthesis transcription factor PdxR n=1 Tax=Paenibacillus kobensis TaxID=59841 RepID=UPI0013E2E8D4|nr:PLP-dependent aminotransferase family protein [Paenibacillus kobensis]
MFDIRLAEETDNPLYIRLYHYIRQLIESGSLLSGTKLPSIRALREQSGLSRTTVETAYHMLLEEGFAQSKPRSGIFVSGHSGRDSGMRPAKLGVSEPAVPDTSEQHTSVSLDGGSLIDFNMLNVDRGTFPAAAWRSAVSDALTLHSESLHQYGDPQGEYGLRASIAQYLSRSRGVNCTPEQIVIGSGIASSIHLLARLLPDLSAVAVEQAGIAQVREKFQQHGFLLAALPFAPEQQWAEELTSRDIRAVYVTPSHRPTGQPLTYPLRRQLLDWAQRNDGYIIEDDYDGEFYYSGRTIPSLQGLDDGGTVIYTGTFSKSFTPALRMGYTVLPASLLSKLNDLRPILAPPSRIDQWAMELFISRGHWYRHIRRMRSVYRRKHNRMTELIRACWPDQVHINGDHAAGLHVELTVYASCGASRLIELAANAGVRVYGPQDAYPPPGPINSGDSQDSALLYLGFGSVTEAEMERGIQRLALAWLPVWSDSAR